MHCVHIYGYSIALLYLFLLTATMGFVHLIIRYDPYIAGCCFLVDIFATHLLKFDCVIIMNTLYTLVFIKYFIYISICMVIIIPQNIYQTIRSRHLTSSRYFQAIVPSQVMYYLWSKCPAFMPVLKMPFKGKINIII